MRETYRIRYDSLPRAVMQDLERSGHGWADARFPTTFWIKTDTKKGR